MTAEISQRFQIHVFDHRLQIEGIEILLVPLVVSGYNKLFAFVVVCLVICFA